jgi:hypothetical protein
MKSEQAILPNPYLEEEEEVSYYQFERNAYLLGPCKHTGLPFCSF